ncbi:MAG: hypothetical protein Kow0042_25640 [Calditrichia bacterium]
MKTIKKDHIICEIKSKNYIYYLIIGMIGLGSLLYTYCAKNPTEPTPPQKPRVTQTATLQNNIDIKYTAKLENILKAQRQIFRDNQLIKSDSISGPDYSEILPDNEKGNYMFVSLSDTAKVVVSNYPPEANISYWNNFNKYFKEGEERVFNLQNAFYDKNIEDNPVFVIEAVPSDSKLEVFLNSYELKVKALKPGNSGINFKAGSEEGGFVNKYVNVMINQLPQTEINQTATLENLVDIKYKAVFKNTNQAKLNILKNNQQIISKTISPNVNDSTYTELFTYSTHGQQITKGVYDFVANFKTAYGKDTSSVVSLEIPEYPLNVSLSNLPTEMDEEDTIDIDLESRIKNSAVNPEDNPVTLEGAVSNDGKTEVSTNGYILEIIALGDNTENYSIGIELEKAQGTTENKTISGYIHDLPRIQGVLKSNEPPQEGVLGTLRAYTLDGTLLQTKTSDIHGNNFTDSQGNFDFKIKKRSSQLQDIAIHARQGTLGNYQGWVRLKKIPGQDINNLIIKAVPYAPYENNPQEFYQFMTELCSEASNTRFDLDGSILHGLPGFEDFQGLERIRVLEHDYTSAGTYTQNQFNIIKNKIIDPNDISGMIGNFTIDPNIIVFGNDSTFTDYSVDTTRGFYNIIPEKGVIVTVPRVDFYYAGLADPSKAGTIVYGGVIYIDPNLFDWYFKSTISHEFGHFFIGDHTFSLYGQSVMAVNPNPINTAGPADKKAGWIIYTPEYIRDFSHLGLYPRIEFLPNLMRQEFGSDYIDW